MYSTVEDLYRWDEALGTPKLLSRRSWAAMFSPHVSPCAGGACITSSAFSRLKIVPGVNPLMRSGTAVFSSVIHVH